MKILTVLCSSFIVVMLASCEEKPKSKIDNPMSNYTQALDKAKQVEGVLLKAAGNRDKALEEMIK